MEPSIPIFWRQWFQHRLSHKRTPDTNTRSTHMQQASMRMLTDTMIAIIAHLFYQLCEHGLQWRVHCVPRYLKAVHIRQEP
jgi:hypothetical protein